MNKSSNELFSVSEIVSCEDSIDLSEPETKAKIQHEVHRMFGLLRFTPNENGEFIAICEPDFNILSELKLYFTARFGDTPWSIIDIKRGLLLRRLPGEDAKISACEESVHDQTGSDEWEELWKHYHRTINNEQRNNPGLQRQFMPKRYWKHLPEKCENEK